MCDMDAASFMICRVIEQTGKRWSTGSLESSDSFCQWHTFVCVLPCFSELTICVCVCECVCENKRCVIPYLEFLWLYACVTRKPQNCLNKSLFFQSKKSKLCIEEHDGSFPRAPWWNWTSTNCVLENITFDTSRHPHGSRVRGTYDEVSILHGLVLIKHFPACWITVKQNIL